MDYYYQTKVQGNFDDVVNKTIEALKLEGFGVLTQINLQETFKAKLDVDFPKYLILGACNPQFAYEALKLENKVGTMLPCNLIVQELDNGPIEVSAVNPEKSMQAIKNPALIGVAKEVSKKLNNVIKQLGNEK